MSTQSETKAPVAEENGPFRSDAKNRIILQYPDITLKGKNQKEFQDTLSLNIRRHLQHKGYAWNLGASHGRACISVPEGREAHVGHVVDILRKMPGISSLAAAVWLRPEKCVTANGGVDWESIGGELANLARRYYKKDASFAIHVNRTDKSFHATSQEIGTHLGNIIRRDSEWETVRLTGPDQVFYLDVHSDGFYLYAEKIKGVGGLPVGTGGRVLALLSGGIDSPVAAYSLAKRGCQVDFFHMSAGHMRERELKSSVITRIAAMLSQYTQQSRLYIVPYTYFDLALHGKKDGYELVLFRRFMMRAAEKLAVKTRALALVNGDSLGQVASQTLENLVSSTRAVSIPVFRPLIGANKEEIIKTARRIGSYDISIEPYKDCCALIARHPKTRSSHAKLDAIESARLPDYAELLEKTFADMICLEFRYGEPVLESF